MLDAKEVLQLRVKTKSAIKRIALIQTVLSVDSNLVCDEARLASIELLDEIRQTVESFLNKAGDKA